MTKNSKLSSKKRRLKTGKLDRSQFLATIKQIDLIQALHDFPEGLHITELEKRTKSPRSSVSVGLKKLRESGLVDKRKETVPWKTYDQRSKTRYKGWRAVKKKEDKVELESGFVLTENGQTVLEKVEELADIVDFAETQKTRKYVQKQKRKEKPESKKLKE